MPESAETRWRMGIARKWDTPELQGQRPAAALWCAILNANPYLAPTGDAKKPRVEAHINHDAWLADCPFCGTVQHASTTDPRFYCAGCCNQNVDRHLIPVVFPKNAEQIVQQLELRPLPKFRSWHPGESVKDLQLQDEQAIAQGLHETVV